MDLLQSILNDSSSGENLVLLNPSLDLELQKNLRKIAAEQDFNSSHVWLTSSGSTASSQREIKLIALSKMALFTSAQAVNQHLNSISDDRWLNVLPLFHVGGLGIFYRAHLSGSAVVNLHHPGYKWNPVEFYQKLKDEQITLTSLVPTQVFDLVARKYVVPQKLRAIIIGGAALTSELYLKARELGWPVLPSFGMTEVCSQIATAPLSSLIYEGALLSKWQLPKLQLLSHVQTRTDEESILSIRSSSLMSCLIRFDGQKYKKDHFAESEWYKTQDLVKTQDNHLELIGRIDDIVKVLGENVNLAFLRANLAKVLLHYNLTDDWALVAHRDSRKGNQLHLVLEQKNININKLIDRALTDFHQQVLPFERITQIKFIENIPRSAIGKILYGKLEELLFSNI
jgi:O-succinylbenzoic acid--CoA ligase